MRSSILTITCCFICLVYLASCRYFPIYHVLSKLLLCKTTSLPCKDKVRSVYSYPLHIPLVESLFWDKGNFLFTKIIIQGMTRWKLTSHKWWEHPLQGLNRFTSSLQNQLDLLSPYHILFTALVRPHFVCCCDDHMELV